MNKIQRGALQFARIFDNADALVWKLTNYFSNDGVALLNKSNFC
ncbi:hypothetical protein OYA64_20315 [Escherichia coli]|nr:hypothetical protein [Escherichia coli]